MNTDTVILEFDIGTTEPNAKLGVRALIDGTVFHENSHVTETYHVAHEISDSDNDHVLEIELYGKRHEHTEVNETGDIVQDALITVTNIQLDDIDVAQLSQQLFAYHHDFNGTQPLTVDKFYGSLGCNGTIKLKFTTPIYLWLLENM